MRTIGGGFAGLRGLGLARRAARLAQRGGGVTMVKEKHDGAGKAHFSEVLDNLAAAKGVKRTDLNVKGLVGETSGEVYKLLEGKGEVPFKQVRGALENKGPLTFMAVGWLLKEDKLEVRILEKGIALKTK
jgi:hypothetical protein